MDRLLTNDEICQTCPAIAMRTTEHKQLRCSVKTCLVHPDLKHTAKAQLAKADREWVEWAEQVCPHGIGDFFDGDDVATHCFKLACEQCWQERKRSIGI